MKRNYSAPLIVSMLIMIFIYSCDNSTTPPQESDTLILNDSNYVNLSEFIFNTEEKLKLSYLNLAEDSRCPFGAVCFWEGNAKVDVAFIVDDLTHLLELNTHQDFQIDTTIDNYYLKLLDVEPYPVLDSSHVGKDGRIKIYISKIE